MEPHVSLLQVAAGKYSQLYCIGITMGYFFRRTAKIGPVRLNFSKSGIGASVGVKGARLTVTPSGTTYITVGRNGFYYRETIARGSRSSQPPLVPPLVDSASSAEIPTADVSELIDSSSEQLVNALNERARMVNPAWLEYVVSAILFVLSMRLRPDATPPTAATVPLADPDYATLVARNGYPDSVIDSNPLGVVPVRTAFYTNANVRVIFVQGPCVSAYENVIEVLRFQKNYPKLAEDKIKGLRPCLASAEDPWIARGYKSNEYDVDIAAERLKSTLQA